MMTGWGERLLRSSCFVGSTNLLHGWLAPAAILLILVVVVWLSLRWVRAEHLETLAAVPLFAGLSERELLSILNSARVVEFGPGSPIVTEGETGKGFYVITKGQAKVSVAGTDVAKLGEGSYFGEMAALDGGPRAATIMAETAVATLELTSSALRHILDKEPAVARSISLELRRHLAGAGGAPPVADDSQVTSAELIALSQQLRGIEHPEWAQPRSPKHRWLGFSRAFARGQ